MSYTIDIKNEIALSLDKYTNIEVIAELSGFIRNNGNISKDSILITTENKNIALRIITFVKRIYDIQGNIKIIKNLNFSKKPLYQVEFVDKDYSILLGIGYYDSNHKYLINPPSYILDDMETIRSYLRGAFLCTGSINDPKTSRYHLELLINKPKEAVFIQKLLNNYDLNAKILNRDKGYMIYIKEADKISDFIKILGANQAVLYYENIRVYRDEKNLTNRLNNCEQANLDKTISTASKQLKDIQLLEYTRSLSLLDEKCLQVVEYRKKYPETSLKELADIISRETKKPLTKSGLNHRLRKITNLAERIRKNLKENSK